MRCIFGSMGSQSIFRHWPSLMRTLLCSSRDATFLLTQLNVIKYYCHSLVLATFFLRNVPFGVDSLLRAWHGLTLTRCFERNRRLLIYSSPHQSRSEKA